LSSVRNKRKKQNKSLLFVEMMLMSDPSRRVSIAFVFYSYVSTMTMSQRIISEKGVMFGPGKADEYAKQFESGSFLTSPDVQPMPPLAGLGYTIQALLDKGIVFTEQQRKKLYSKSKSVKGWSLSDFWE
jgi:hypothetical protein